ncbi:hypothetical protein [Wolbachia phage WO]|nr:hypothetical protein [Wolbachia phage WO]
MYPTLTAYFNSRFGGKFCKHQKKQYSKLQHTTPRSSTCRAIYSLFESESVLENS